MSVTFIHPQTKTPKTIPSGFNWIQFFLNFWGISSFVYGLIGEGIFLVILYAASFSGFIIRTGGSQREVDLGNGIQLGAMALIFLYSIYLGISSNKMRAYRLVKKGYLIKDVDNPAIVKQLKRWKIRDSVIKPFREVKLQESTNLDELKKLGELLKNGIITQEEFDVKKKQLLK